jgi:hypothetical protein
VMCCDDRSVPQNCLTVCITLLSHSHGMCCVAYCAAMLQVKNAAGQWVDAPPLPGTFVCNIGDCFEVGRVELHSTAVKLDYIKINKIETNQSILI